MTKPRWVFRTVAGLAVASALLTTGCGSTQVRESASVVTAEQQRSLTPDSVLAELKAGNERFVAGNSTSYDWLAQVEQTAAGQFPKAIVLGCLDSRVPPEAVFDQGIGDIFVGRVAGNFENEDLLGSMEFGSKVAGAKLIVVLGHTACGAVMGAIDRAELGNLTATLTNIQPAVVAVAAGSQGRTSKDKAYVDRVAEENVRQTVRDIRARSPVLASMESAGQIKIVGAMYDLQTGRVRWLSM